MSLKGVARMCSRPARRRAVTARTLQESAPWCGHCCPLWSRFRGGKGVATSAGTSIVCFPAYMPFDLALAGGTVWLSKGQAGTATYIASGVFTAAAHVLAPRGKDATCGAQSRRRGCRIYAASTSAIIAYKFLTAPRTCLVVWSDECRR